MAPWLGKGSEYEGLSHSFALACWNADQIAIQRGRDDPSKPWPPESSIDWRRPIPPAPRANLRFTAKPKTVTA